MKLDIWETTLVWRAIQTAAEHKRQKGKHIIRLQLEADALERTADALLDGNTLEPS